MCQSIEVKADAPELSGKEFWIGLSYAPDSEQAELVKTVLGLGADAPKARHGKWSEPSFRVFSRNHSQTARLSESTRNFCDVFGLRQAYGGGETTGNLTDRPLQATPNRLRSAKEFFRARHIEKRVVEA